MLIKGFQILFIPITQVLGGSFWVQDGWYFFWYTLLFVQVFWSRSGPFVLLFEDEEAIPFLWALFLVFLPSQHL